MNQRHQKGQFSIIAALLVSIVLVTAIITTYTIVRNTPIQERPKILGTIDEINIAINRILSFAVGYYGSIMQVTGNTTYARGLVLDYIYDSLENVVYTHPDWGPSFQVNYARLRTTWFNQTSSSTGTISLNYSLIGLGIYEIQYESTAGLAVSVNPSNTSHILVDIARDTKQPYPALLAENFFFYNYSYTDSAWELHNTGLVVNSIASSETYTRYNITVPSWIDPSSYMLQVIDPRGIRATASTFSDYTFTFNWNQTLYTSLNQDTIAVEVLQNGTLRYLGQNFPATGKPIPPIPAKAFRINDTQVGVNREAPFQVEDWGSNYRVPLGLTTNTTIFSSRQLLVFLLNNVENVTTVKLWWDGRDIANQTPYAYTNRYFEGDDPSSRTLTNGRLTLTLSSSGFSATSRVVGSSTTSTASFLRINGENPVYGAAPAYVIHHGIVRDIVQQEAEYSGGVAGCPNFYAQIVLTLPANATYYTYTTRLIFADSTQSRTITDLTAVRLTVSSGSPLTENGTLGGLPISSSATGLFSNYSPLASWAHHWSQFGSGSLGAGIMFTDTANTRLYVFDQVAGAETGALNVIGFGRIIEFSPVAIAPASFQDALDVGWQGAIVSFDGTDPIYRSSDGSGLWAIVESPPTVAIS